MKKLLSIIAVAAIAVSCNAPTNTSNTNNMADANKAKVQRFYDEVINAHNPAMVDSFCQADFLDHNPDQGHSGKGIEDLKAQFKEFFAAFPDIHVKTNFMVAEGDKVVGHVTMSGTNSGAMGGMPATNKKIEIDGIDIIQIKDGKANERWGVFDTMKMMSQLGMPGPGAPPAGPEKK